MGCRSRSELLFVDGRAEVVERALRSTELGPCAMRSCTVIAGPFSSCQTARVVNALAMGPTCQVIREA